MFKNIIYSESISRPSKSLLNPGLYTEFKQTTIDPYEKCKAYSHIECSNNIKCEYITIKDFTYFSEVLEIIYSLPEDNFLIELKDIYTYPQIQFIELLQFLFKNVDCKFSQFTNACYIYCVSLTYLVPDSHNYNNSLILKNSIVKDLGIKVSPNLIDIIYTYNNDFFKKIISLNNIISKLYNHSLDLNVIHKEIDIMNDYYIAYINKKNNYKVCNCDKLFNSMLLNCYICEECFSLNVLDYITPFSELSTHEQQL